jgi:hypothetical protein
MIPSAGRWVGLVSGKDKLLEWIATNDTYSSAGRDGLYAGIFNCLQGWLYTWFCVPCNVLKIALGGTGKVMGARIYPRCSIGWRTTVFFQQVIKPARSNQTHRCRNPP